MRDLVINEINQVSAGNFVGDMQAMVQDGLTHPEKSLGVVALGVGIVVGGVMPSIMVPICAIGVVLGWYIYDSQTTPAAPATTTASTTAS